MTNRYHHHTYIGSFYDINNFKYLSLGEILYPNSNGFYDLSTVNKLPDYVYENYNNWVDKKYLKEIFERANDFTKHGCKNLIDIRFRQEDSEWQIRVQHIVRKPMYIIFELFRLSLSDVYKSTSTIDLTIPSKCIELSYTYTFPLYKNIKCVEGPNPLDTVCKVSLKIYSREIRAYYKYNFDDMFDTFYSDVELYLFLDKNGIRKPGDKFNLVYDSLE